MPEKNTDNREKILEAMWRGDLRVKDEKPVEEPAEEKAVEEKSEEEKRALLRDAMEHLLSGKAFKEREY